VEAAAGKTVVETGSGRIRIGRIGGPAVVKNANGDTWIREVAGEGRVRAANGDIAIDVAGAGVVAKTANGSVRLGEVSDGAVEVHTAFGDLEVGVHDGVAAWLDLHTSFGNMVNELDEAADPGAGEATVQVRASTSYGDIRIHRSSATGATRGAS
jgi:DUF4097 and DUF4098 domain-containing protein YvlB